MKEEKSEYTTGEERALRRGVTTGSCAAAAVSACARELFTGEQSDVTILTLPGGERIHVNTFRLSEKCEDGAEACYCVYKDSGDDPDVTNGAKVIASVILGRPESYEKINENAFIYNIEVNGKMVCTALYGGEGIGIVTKPGLEVEIGKSAINKVPRQMIIEEVEKALLAGVRINSGIPDELSVVVSIPEGKMLAERTFNPNMGIEGGISVLGTTGIIEPMSNKALIDTIRLQIRQKYALGEQTLIISPGNYGSRYLEEEMSVSEDRIVKCSNYIGEAIDCAVETGFKDMIIVGDVGKLCKLAAGIFNTHSHTADGRGTVFALHCMLCGGSTDAARRIMAAVSTQAMMDILNDDGILDKVAESIMNSIAESIEQRGHNKIKYKVVLFSSKYGLFGEKTGDIKG